MGGATSARAPRSIVLNAGDDINGNLLANTPGFFVKPVRPIATAAATLNYNPATNEIFYVSASRRYKTDIQDVEASEWARVWDLRPVSYRSLDTAEEGPKSYGFIAEEVAQVDSRLVFWGPDGEGLPQVEGVNYDQVIPLLLQAVKELKTARETDAIRIQALENKLDTLV